METAQTSAAERFTTLGGLKTVFVRPERCIGCRQCEFACALEHSMSRDPARAPWESPAPHARIHVEAGFAMNSSFPNRCHHCDPAPCEQACPTAAIYRDRELGLVLVEPAKCIACAMCAMVCPFDVITFYPMAANGHARIAAVKCDGCLERVSRGGIPACAEACKVGALVYGELNEILRQERALESRVVLAASGAALAELSRAPENVAGWRQWGNEASRVAGGLR